MQWFAYQHICVRLYAIRLETHCVSIDPELFSVYNNTAIGKFYVSKKFILMDCLCVYSMVYNFRR